LYNYLKMGNIRREKERERERKREINWGRGDPD
jgi:hypothetical protein